MRQPLALATLAVLCLLVPIALAAEPARVVVYKSPTCGCCSKWIDHLEEHGFAVESHDVPDVRPLKAENGVPLQLSSCHTAIVGGYVVEGHVPAQDVTRLLAERPEISGLAVPGMPIGSPGMEGPNPESYRVFSFGGPGGIEVFSSHPAR